MIYWCFINKSCNNAETQTTNKTCQNDQSNSNLEKNAPIVHFLLSLSLASFFSAALMMKR